MQTAKYFIENASENEALDEEERQFVHEQDLRRLEEMVGYCKTSGCLRAYLLRYFGEEAPERCSNCGNCVGEWIRQDITVEAQKILSGVVRVEKKYPTGLGLTQIIAMLRGSKKPAGAAAGAGQALHLRHHARGGPEAAAGVCGVF